MCSRRGEGQNPKSHYKEPQKTFYVGKKNFQLFFKKTFLRLFLWIFIQILEKILGASKGGVNKVSCRRGDSDFSLQEGGNGTLSPPHAHVCSAYTIPPRTLGRLISLAEAPDVPAPGAAREGVRLEPPVFGDASHSAGSEHTCEEDVNTLSPPPRERGLPCRSKLTLDCGDGNLFNERD